MLEVVQMKVKEADRYAVLPRDEHPASNGQG